MDHFDFSKIINMLFPVLLAAIGWLLTQITTLQVKVQELESKMPMLITPQGTPTDSPLSAEARYKLRDELTGKLNELSVRVRILEKVTEGK
jgi:predicted RecB family nuclease